ncbi:MAG: hypothetical protein AAGD01_07755 [Acidobacteriota bacterium]
MLPQVQVSPQQQPAWVGVQGQVTGQVQFAESVIWISFDLREFHQGRH